MTEPIAINRLTGTLFGEEPGNGRIDQKIVEEWRDLNPRMLTQGEFGDTASTIAAGSAMSGSSKERPMELPTPKWIEDDFPTLSNGGRE